jgi:3-hydroxyacyl-CoA dehydrogenase
MMRCGAFRMMIRFIPLRRYDGTGGEDVEKIAVIGCGTMGHSIALSAAWAGYDVKMQGIDDADIDRGLESIQVKLQVLIQNGLIDEAKAQLIKNRVLNDDID